MPDVTEILYKIETGEAAAAEELLPEFNDDERVDFLDYAQLGRFWRGNEPSVDLGPTPLGDGRVDMRDVALFSSYWLAEVLPVGLKANWKLDETEGDVARDSAGGYDAQVMGDILWHRIGNCVLNFRLSN